MKTVLCKWSNQRLFSGSSKFRDCAHGYKRLFTWIQRLLHKDTKTVAIVY